VESKLDRRSFIATGAAFAVGSLSGVDKGGDVAERAAVGSGLQAQRLAWAGVRLQLEKATLFLDPLINPDVWGPALKDKVIPVEPLEGDRYVVVTHRHPDHFDPQAVRKILGEEGIIVCDPDVAPLAASYGFKVRVATHYAPILLGDFTVTAVPAVDGYGDPQLSWVVFGGSRRIIHCGDTIWHGAWCLAVACESHGRFDNRRHGHRRSQSKQLHSTRPATKDSNPRDRAWSSKE
jgi:hypothetical protein